MSKSKCGRDDNVKVDVWLHKKDKIRNECSHEEIGVVPIKESMTEPHLTWF